MSPTISTASLEQASRSPPRLIEVELEKIRARLPSRASVAQTEFLQVEILEERCLEELDLESGQRVP
jgi:hypothetical protein